MEYGREIISSFAQKSEADNGVNGEKTEKRNLLDRLKVIIQTISGKKNLAVTDEVDARTLIQMMTQGKDAHKEWYRQTQHDPESKEVIKELVHVPKDIMESENSSRGKAAHEAGHVAITRFGEFIPDEVLQELGFHAVISSAEERATDQVVRRRYEGAGKWVDEARRDSIKESSLLRKSKERIGYIPKFNQLCDLIVYGRYFSGKEEISDIYDQEVVKLYETIKEYIEYIEKTIPEEGSAQEEVINKAKKRYAIIYKKIWPEVKKLISSDLQKEKRRQMIQESLKSKEESEPKFGKGVTGDPLEKLSDDLKNELESIIEQAAQEENKEGDGDTGITEENETGENIKNTAEMSKSAEDSEKSESKEGGTAKAKEKSEIPIPMDKLSKELSKAIDEIIKNLPDQDKKAIEQEARKTLEEIEDSIVEDNSGTLLDEPAETHKEHKERKEEEKRERKKEEENQKIKKDLEESERRQATLQESSTIYDETYESIREFDEELYLRLEEIFTPNIKRTVRLKSSGSKINLPAIFRWEADKSVGLQEIDNRIFESVHLPEKKDYALTILVDLSGSMRGEKIEKTFKALVLLIEVLNRLGIKNEISGFQDEVIEFKKFDEQINDTIRKKISGMLKEVSGDNQGGHNKPSYNDDGPCVREASDGLGNEPAKEKFLLVLSDGVPEGRRSDKSDLHESVKHIMISTDQKLIGIGLGEDTEHVKKFYPTSLPNLEVDKLPEALGDLLEDLIRNPQKYAHNKDRE